MSRGARFVWVGAAGFAVQLAVLQALAIAAVPYLVATVVAVEAAILHNFFWHERWTWNDRPASGRRLTRLVRFNGVTALISVGGNVALTAAFAGRLHLPLLAGNALAILVLGLVNFAATDRLVFSAASRTPRAADPLLRGEL